jgi:hypothetical protein
MGIFTYEIVLRGQWPRWNSNVVDFLGEYEAICGTALGRESWPNVGLIDEKNRGSKISWHCPFNSILFGENFI